MSGDPRPKGSSIFAPSGRGRSLRVVDGRTVRASGWLLALALLLAGGAALLALRLALDAEVQDSASPPIPSVGAAPG